MIREVGKLRGRSLLLCFERRSAYVVAAIMLRAVLEWAYFVFVNQYFSYAGFVIEFSLLKYLESWVIYLVLAFSFPCLLNRASDYLLSFLFAALLAPLLVMYAYADEERFTLYCVLLGTLLIVVFRMGRPLRLPVVRGGQQVGIALMVLLAGFVSAWFVISGGLAYFNLDLTKVYEFRRASAEVTGGYFLSYINAWAPKIAGPVLLAYCLWKKWYALAIAVVGMHVFWFGITAHKSVLFYPLLILFLWIWFEKTRALSILLMGTAGVLILALVFHLWTGELYFASIFIRRVFFVVAGSTFDYYEFFSSNPKIYWANSLTASFIDYPYRTSAPLVIGNWLGTGSHVNNSFLATGYMHAGVTGIVIYGVMAGLLFRLLDSIVRQGIPIWVGVAAIIVPSQALILSADLPTALLTHGIGLALFILFLLREPSTAVRAASSSRGGI